MWYSGTSGRESRSLLDHWTRGTKFVFETLFLCRFFRKPRRLSILRVSDDRKRGMATPDNSGGSYFWLARSVRAKTWTWSARGFLCDALNLEKKLTKRTLFKVWQICVMTISLISSLDWSETARSWLRLSRFAQSSYRRQTCAKGRALKRRMSEKMKTKLTLPIPLWLHGLT